VGLDGEADPSEPDDGYDSPFVEINERIDVGEALIELGKQLERLPEYRYAWRWAAAALHAASRRPSSSRLRDRPRSAR
jgi:hypothetical protein